MASSHVTLLAVLLIAVTTGFAHSGFPHRLRRQTVNFEDNEIDNVYGIKKSQNELNDLAVEHNNEKREASSLQTSLMDIDGYPDKEDANEDGKEVERERRQQFMIKDPPANSMLVMVAPSNDQPQLMVPPNINARTFPIQRPVVTPLLPPPHRDGVAVHTKTTGVNASYQPGIQTSGISGGAYISNAYPSGSQTYSSVIPPVGYPPSYPPSGYPPPYPSSGYPPPYPSSGYPPPYPSSGYPPYPSSGYPPSIPYQGYPPFGYESQAYSGYQYNAQAPYLCACYPPPYQARFETAENKMLQTPYIFNAPQRSYFTGKADGSPMQDSSSECAMETLSNMSPDKSVMEGLMTLEEKKLKRIEECAKNNKLSKSDYDMLMMLVNKEINMLQSEVKSMQQQQQHPLKKMNK